MKTKNVRAEVKKLVLEKGIENVTNGDCIAIAERTGATIMQVHKVCAYFLYSPQTAKYRK